MKKFYLVSIILFPVLFVGCLFDVQEKPHIITIYPYQCATTNYSTLPKNDTDTTLVETWDENCKIGYPPVSLPDSTK